MKRVGFHTLGCKVNQYETEAMEELFEERGYKVVTHDDKADVYVINTCTVTNMSARKSRQFIRRSRRNNKNAIIAVVGCYSQISPEEVEEIEGVDVILGTSARNDIVNLVEEAGQKKGIINVVENTKNYNQFEKINIENIDGMTRAYIKIQDGCNQYCSYCIIPYARGPIRSRLPEDIIEEVKNLSKKGFKEVVLTGIHVASYGKDLGNIDLARIIDEISKIDGIERIRLSSIEPGIITEDFMETITKTNKVCDHFHLSLQSGSDKILEKMNRKYTTKEFRDIVKLIRKYMPQAGITTDVIVGFPEETEDDFINSMKFIEEIGFSRIHVFKYSPREGTPAAKRKQIHGEIKNNRSEKLIKLGDNLAEEFGNRLIGETVEVLIEEEIDGYYEGYTSNYMRVKIIGNDSLINKIVNINILDYKNDILIGELKEV